MIVFGYFFYLKINRKNAILKLEQMFVYARCILSKMSYPLASAMGICRNRFG